MFAKLLKPGPYYSWKKVTIVIAMLSLCISGGAQVAYFFWCLVKNINTNSKLSVIETIVQKPTTNFYVQNNYFAEILELSKDEPTNFFQYDVQEAKKRLLKTNMFKCITVKKMKPNSLYIEYEMRSPIAVLGDYTNTVVDQDGFLFPYSPFYVVTNLPEVRLGNHLPLDVWGRYIAQDQLVLLKDILYLCGSKKISKIDLSEYKNGSAGHREIVLLIDKGTLIRLSKNNYVQEIASYLALDDQIKLPERCILDLRNPGLGALESVDVAEKSSSVR